MALLTSTQAEIALKHLLGKSQTASSATKGPNNEAETLSLINNSNNIWVSTISSNPLTAVTNNVAEFVIANLTLDPTSNGQAFFATYPSGHPLVGQRVTNAIPPTYGVGYEAKPYAGASLIPPGDLRDWIYQYQSGVFYQQTSFATPTPTTIQLYVYKGQTLFDNLNYNTVLFGGLMSSGVIEYSGITKTSNTTFYISPVKGWIIDNTTNPILPTIKYVTYSGSTNNDSPYRTTNTFTYVLLNSGGTINYQTTLPTPQQRRENIYLGKIGHPDKLNYSIVFQNTDFNQSPLSQVRDMFIPIPLINDGVYPFLNSGLTINISSGTLYGLGIGFNNNRLNPNSLSLSGTTNTIFQYRTQTGGTLTNITTIDPSKYDNNGIISTIGSPSKQATNQRIFLLQDGSIRIQYGQTVYPDLDSAISGIQSEFFITFPNFKENAILIGILSLRSDTTNLNNKSYSKLTYASKFGETFGTGGGGDGEVTLQNAYNNSTEPEILTNNTLGALTLKIGSSSNNDNVLEIKDNTGVIVSSINGNGLGSFKNLQLSGLTSSTYNRFLVSDSNGNIDYRTDVLTGTTSLSGITFINNVITTNQNGGGSSTYTINAVTGGTYSNGVLTLEGSGNISNIINLPKIIQTGNTVNGYNQSIYSIIKSAHTGAFFDYTVSGSTGVRIGTIMSVWTNTNVEFSEVSTNDIGNTSFLTFTLEINGNFVNLISSSTSGTWIIKLIIKLL